MERQSEPHAAPALPLPNLFEFKSLLLVDDDRQLAEELQWALAAEGYMVDAAYDGADALRKIEARPFDAVICDVMMPKLRGDQLYRYAIETRPSLRYRFLFITGFAADPWLNRFLSRTGCRYLLKPFRIRSLLDSVRQQTAYAATDN